MFDLQQFKERMSVVSDRGESLTYGQLSEEVERMAAAFPRKGLVFTLCENLLGSFVGYVACMNKHIPQVLLDGSKDLELVQRLIGIYGLRPIGFKRFQEGSRSSRWCMSILHIHFLQLISQQRKSIPIYCFV